MKWAASDQRGGPYVGDIVHSNNEQSSSESFDAAFVGGSEPNSNAISADLDNLGQGNAEHEQRDIEDSDSSILNPKSYIDEEEIQLILGMCSSHQIAKRIVFSNNSLTRPNFNHHVAGIIYGAFDETWHSTGEGGGHPDVLDVIETLETWWQGENDIRAKHSMSEAIHALKSFQSREPRNVQSIDKAIEKAIHCAQLIRDRHKQNNRGDTDAGRSSEAVDPKSAPNAKSSQTESTLIEFDQWPAPLGKEAYYGVVGDFMELVLPRTEADPASLIFQFLAFAGSVVGHGPHFRFEDDCHSLNLFMVIVGDTAKARKGTSLGRVRKVFENVDPKWTARCIVEGISSGEGLAYQVRDPTMKMQEVNGQFEEKLTDPGVEDKRLLVTESEFARVLDVARRNGSVINSIIRQAWDSGRLKFLNKTEPFATTNAHISIIGHITETELHSSLDKTDVANGFANRFLWVASKRSKRLPESIPITDAEYQPITRLLQQYLGFAKNIDGMKRDAEAGARWRKIYDDLSEGKPGVLGMVTSRGEAQVMRIACIYALLDRSDIIKIQHLEAALAVWKYSENSAAYVFGNSVGDPIADRVLAALREEYPQSLTQSQIINLLGRNCARTRLQRSLNLLLKSGLVLHKTGEGAKGRPPIHWFATDRK